MTILALDFDAVLHPAPVLGVPVADTLLCRLPMLEEWLRQRPAVDVLISSAWRKAFTADELRGLFSPDRQGRVLGVTPQLLVLRQTEIEVWMEQHAPRRRWVAIDDMPDLFEARCRRLVVYESAVALTSEGLAALDALIETLGAE